MKKILGTALTFLLTAALAVSASAAEIWSDLQFTDGTPVDATGNTTMIMVGGAVENTTVTFDGKEYPVTAYVGKETGDCIEVELPFDMDGEELGEFLMAGNTFEAFFQVQELPGSTVGLYTNCNSGGVTLYLRGADSQLNYQIGTTADPNDSELGGGRYAAAVKYGDNYKGGAGQPENAFLIPAQIEHVVGTYDKETKTLSCYHNGELVSSGTYGSGEFHIGSAFGEVLAIGTNVAYPSESLGAKTEYRIVDANIYKGAMTADEVKAQYASLMASIGIGADAVAAGEAAEAEAAAAEAADKAAADADAAAALKAATEAALASAVEPGAAWSDLDLTDGAPADKAGNTTFTVVGGAVTDTTVLHEGKEYPVKAYVGAADGEYLELKLPFADAAASGEFYMNGTTFEIFFQTQNPIGGTVGLICSCNGGGITLYSRGGDAQLNFQIGADPNDSELGCDSKYACAVYYNDNNKTSESQPANVWHIPGQIEHVVGVYDKETNKLSLYHNGLLISSGDFGTGAFRAGSMTADTLGIGMNVAYTSENIGRYTEYRVVDANIYDRALTAEEVAGAYKAQLTAIGALGAAEEVPAETEAPAVETAAPETEAPAVEVPAETEAEVVETEAPAETEAEVVVTEPEAPQTFDAAVIAAVAAIVSAAGYAISKKRN
ncbi:MAG: hypothetical protein IJF78_06360 [Clostridia bacterium]|nr:hypothetical protein [Clostridia bacterium]